MTAPLPGLPPLWKHQIAAFEFIRGLWRAGRHGGMLAMWMGTGKSRVATELAVDLDAKLVLIVSPLRVIDVWRGQLERFAPGRFHFAALDDRSGTVAEKTAEARGLIHWASTRNQYLAIGINYESARYPPFAKLALNTFWPLVILDESHRIKEAGGRTSRFCSLLSLRARHRLALTGTPMPHEPTDIWGQFRFLDRSILDPTYGAFRLRHAIMGGYLNKKVTGWRDLDQLYEKFSQIAYRVDESVLDLPPEMDQVLAADPSPEGGRIYREMESEMVAWIRTSETAGITVTAANALVRLLRLQQITGGSLPHEDGTYHVVDDAKEQLLTEFFEDLGAEPAVVFAVFKSDLAAIHRAAAVNGQRTGELSGARDDLAAWQRGSEDDPTILAVQIQAGDVGIDLTRARIGVYYSLGFSLSHYLQSRARIRRPPQTRPCVYYHLQIRHSVDEFTLRAVLARQDLITSVLGELKRHA